MDWFSRWSRGGGREGVQRFHHAKSCQTCWEPQSANLKSHSQNKFVWTLSACVNKVILAIRQTVKTYHSFIRLPQTDLQTANVRLLDVLFMPFVKQSWRDAIHKKQINTHKARPSKTNGKKKSWCFHQVLHVLSVCMCLSTCCIVMLLVILAAICGTHSKGQVTTGMKYPVEFRCLTVYNKVC